MVKLASRAAEERIEELEAVVGLLKKRIAMQERLLRFSVERRKESQAKADVTLANENAKLRAENAKLQEHVAALRDTKQRLDLVCGLLERNGCDCECDHSSFDHDDDCDRCLACRIGEAVGV